MASKRAVKRPESKSDETYVVELNAASPPVSSRNVDFRYVHDEIMMLQNIARVFLGTVLEDVGDGRRVGWGRFITDSTPHRNVSSVAGIETFLTSKLTPPRRGR